MQIVECSAFHCLNGGLAGTPRGDEDNREMWIDLARLREDGQSIHIREHVIENQYAGPLRELHLSGKAHPDGQQVVDSAVIEFQLPIVAVENPESP